MSLEFKQLDGCDLPGGLIEQIARLRLEVWSGAAKRVKKTRPELWISQHDYTNRHFLVFSEGELVASARLDFADSVEGLVDAKAITNCFPYWRPSSPIAFLKLLVVHPVARSKGVAGLLDTARVDFAVSREASVIIGAAVSWRQAALAKLGFKSLGEIPPSENQYYDEKWFFMEKTLTENSVGVEP